MFKNCIQFNSDLSFWNVAAVTTMEEMFKSEVGTMAIKQLLCGGQWEALKSDSYLTSTGSRLGCCSAGTYLSNPPKNSAGQPDPSKFKQSREFTLTVMFETHPDDFTENKGVAITQVGGAKGTLKTALTYTTKYGVSVPISKSIASSSTSTTVFMKSTTRTIAVGDKYEIFGHTGDSANTAMNQVLTVSSVPYLWTFEIASQSITESVGATVFQNEWTLGIESQSITESIGATVTQGSVTGTLKHKAQNEWIFVITKQIIKADKGIEVTQGNSKVTGSIGTLQAEMDGETTKIVIDVATPAISFVSTVDLMINTGKEKWEITITPQAITEIINAPVEQVYGCDSWGLCSFSNRGTLQTALDATDVTSFVIVAHRGVRFETNHDIVIGSTTVKKDTITAAKNFNADITILADNIVSATGAGKCESVVINTDADVTFVDNVDVVIGSTTIVHANINLATEWSVSGILDAELTGTTTNLKILAASGVTFKTTADLIIGSTTVARANVNDAGFERSKTEVVFGGSGMTPATYDTGTIIMKWLPCFSSSRTGRPPSECGMTTGTCAGQASCWLVVVESTSKIAFTNANSITIGTSPTVVASDIRSIMNTGTGSCGSCDAGRFASDVANAEPSCDYCPDGKFNKLGSTSISSCGNCNAGEYSTRLFEVSSDDLTLEDLSLGIVTFKINLLGHHAPKGTLVEQGKPGCEVSIADECGAKGKLHVALYSDETTMKIVQEKGTFTATSPYKLRIAGGCFNCPIGRFSIAGGKCDICPSGRILIKKDPLDCAICAAGKYQTLSHLDATIKCKDCVGKYISEDVADTEHISCKNCPKGFEFYDTKQCAICGYSKYQNQDDQSNVNCQNCPANTFITDDKKLFNDALLNTLLILTPTKSSLDFP